MVGQTVLILVLKFRRENYNLFTKMVVNFMIIMMYDKNDKKKMITCSCDHATLDQIDTFHSAVDKQ